MFGCCQSQDTKIRTEDGEVIKEKLTKMEEAGWEKEELEEVLKCSCPCHCQGLVVMC